MGFYSPLYTVFSWEFIPFFPTFWFQMSGVDGQRFIEL